MRDEDAVILPAVFLVIIEPGGLIGAFVRRDVAHRHAEAVEGRGGGTARKCRLSAGCPGCPTYHQLTVAITHWYDISMNATMNASTVTSLYPHEVTDLSTDLLLSGLELGTVRMRSGRDGFEIVERHCDCGELLPALVCVPRAPRWDTFPRCSRHAF